MRKARRGIRHAAAFLSVGLLLEVAATLWALVQAVSSGAFKDIRCDENPYLSQQLQLNCDRVELSEVLMSNGSLAVSTLALLPPHNLTSCDSPEEFPLPRNCVCSFDNGDDSCFWTAMVITDEDHPYDGSCFAYPIDEYVAEYGYDSEAADSPCSGADAFCTRSNPRHFGRIVMVMLVASLGLELMEAVLGYKHLRNPLGRARLMAIGTVIEATAIATVLFLLRFAKYGINGLEVYGDNLSRLQENMDVVLGLTFLGSFSEVVFVCSATVADRLPYLGAFGNGVIWLCAAWVEVLVTVYLALRLGEKDIGRQVGLEIAALVVLELLALVIVWAYRILMVTVKMTLLRAMNLPNDAKY